MSITSLPNNMVPKFTQPPIETPIARISETVKSQEAKLTTTLHAEREERKRDDKAKNKDVGNVHLQRRAQNTNQVHNLATALGITAIVESKAQQVIATIRSGNDIEMWLDIEEADQREAAETWLVLKAASFEITDDKDKILLNDITTRFVSQRNIEIKTSLNIAETVSKAYPSTDTAQEMRKIIGQGNQHSYSTRSIFRALLQQFDTDSFAKSLDVYTKSVARDLSDIMPSTDPIYLADTLTHLQSTSTARSLAFDCKNLLKNFMNGDSR